jgi:hypothetical protein
MVMHSADVSNPTLDFPLAKEWSLKIVTEFNAQVAKEEQFRIPVSSMLKVGHELEQIKKNQIGFINFIILPLWSLLATNVPELQECVDEIETNRSKWETLDEL